MGTKDDITARINLFIESMGKSVKKTASEIGMNAPTLLRILKGENKVSADAISSILNAYPDLSAEWLLRGKGSMLITATNDDEMMALNDVITDLTETLKEKNKVIVLLKKQIEENKKGNSND